jgi:hypothetical protein
MSNRNRRIIFLGSKTAAGALGWRLHRHLWADSLDNMGSLKFQSSVDLHGLLLQEYLYSTLPHNSTHAHNRTLFPIKVCINLSLFMRRLFLTKCIMQKCDFDYRTKINLFQSLTPSTLHYSRDYAFPIVTFINSSFELEETNAYTYFHSFVSRIAYRDIRFKI